MKRISLFIAFLTLISVSVPAANYIPIQNFEHIEAVLVSGKPASAEQIREAIIRGGAIRGWQIKESEPGKLSLFLDVRGKHQLLMDATYTDNEYSLLYKSSVNLEEGRKIHEKYLLWVTNLKNDIRGELLKLEFNH